MTALGVGFSHDIEEEGLDIEVEGLVVQKQFCQKTEVLTELLILIAVHFEERDVPLSVDLIP